MKVLNQIKKFPAEIIEKAKYDDFLYLLLQIGTVSLAVSAPVLAPVAMYINALQKKDKKCGEHTIRGSFYYFKAKRYINVQSSPGQTHIELTEEGRKMACLYSAEKILSGNLSSRKLKWDGRWRIIFFDLKIEKNRKRNAIRMMLRRCGFAFLQKSVWVYPHDCSSEVGLLRSFFRLNSDELRLIVSEDIGESIKLKKHFGLS